MGDAGIDVSTGEMGPPIKPGLPEVPLVPVILVAAGGGG
jgi:hypothetical protein